MKKIAFISLLLICLVGCTAKRNAIVEGATNPFGVHGLLFGSYLHHIVIGYDGDSMTTFVDGVPVSKESVPGFYRGGFLHSSDTGFIKRAKPFYGPMPTISSSNIIYDVHERNGQTPPWLNAGKLNPFEGMECDTIPPTEKNGFIVTGNICDTTKGWGFIDTKPTGAIFHGMFWPDSTNADLPLPEWVKGSSFDTIPILYLWCDTTVGAEYILANTFWSYGYEVREPYPYYSGATDGTLVMVLKNGYTHIKYLDRNKIPLDKSIIVWQTKIIP